MEQKWQVDLWKTTWYLYWSLLKFWQAYKIRPKAGQKLNALARISNYLTHDQKRLLNSIIKSQFSYCPLIWMFCSRSLNNLVNRIHKRALRLIHNDHVSSFQDILEMTKEKTIHQNNLVLLKKYTNFWTACHYL